TPLVAARPVETDFLISLTVRIDRCEISNVVGKASCGPIVEYRIAVDLEDGCAGCVDHLHVEPVVGRHQMRNGAVTVVTGNPPFVHRGDCGSVLIKVAADEVVVIRRAPTSTSATG